MEGHDDLIDDLCKSNGSGQKGNVRGFSSIRLNFAHLHGRSSLFERFTIFPKVKTLYISDIGILCHLTAGRSWVLTNHFLPTS